MSNQPAVELSRVNPDTREVEILTGLTLAGGTCVEEGLVKYGAVLTDHRGQRVEIIDGHLMVATAGGLPIHGYQAATIADAWQTIMSVPRECHFAKMIVQTKDAIISFDGGSTEHFYLTTAVDSGVISGLKIPAGSVIKARNAVAGQNWTLLHIFVW